LVNGVERQLGVDLNGDGYIGGEGFLSRLERATHIDFNGDNVIGRAPDVIYPHQSMYGYGGYPSMGYGGYPSMGYGGFPSMGHGGYGPRHFGYY
jgi:hypothetical protein